MFNGKKKALYDQRRCASSSMVMVCLRNVVGDIQNILI